jgi:hypothetical protein
MVLHRLKATPYRFAGIRVLLDWTPERVERALAGRRAQEIAKNRRNGEPPSA